jgi:hypothetical protein
MRDRLDKLKAEGVRNQNRSDFIWHFLLQSFSTMGNSRGFAGLIENRDNYDCVTFDALAQVSPSERLSILQQTLKRAKVRMPLKKAQWLVQNFGIVQRLGGPLAVRDLAFKQAGTTAKIAFLKQFHGIGEKYARNVWMDIYHPDFRNTIAVDERIKRVSDELGVAIVEYQQHERFYQGIATEAGLEPWEVDRLLYHFRDEFLKELRQTDAQPL